MFDHWYPVLLLFTHIFFLIEFLFKIYVAKSFSKFIISMESIIDILTIFPYLIATLSMQDPTDFWYLFWRMLDLLRVLSLYRLLKYIENDINRELWKIILGVLSLVICFTGYA